MFVHGSNVSDIALLILQESYSLSVLVYAATVLTLNNRLIDELSVCWNSVIRRIFAYNKWESVKAVLLRLGRLSIKHLFTVCEN